MPPETFRCSYFPENFAAYAAGSDAEGTGIDLLRRDERHGRPRRRDRGAGHARAREGTERAESCGGDGQGGRAEKETPIRAVGVRHGVLLINQT
jgi:hypothetical protein